MSDPFVPSETWQAGISQPDIVFNSLARRFDLSQLPAQSATTTAQPGSPAERDVYIIPASATGGQWVLFNENDIAIFLGGTWIAFAPIDGMRKYVVDEDANWQFKTGEGWAAEAGGGGGGAVDSVNGQTGVVVLDAADISFDPTGTGLVATTVQAAIAELAAASGGGVQSVVAGVGITVDNSDPENPVVGLAGFDPLWDDVISLLQLEGVDGSTTITDVKGNAWTAFGGAALSDDSKPFGATSLKLDGAGDYIETDSAVAGNAWGTGDFTVEAFVALNSAPGIDYQTIVQPNATQLVAMVANDPAQFLWYENGLYCGSALVSTSTWYHVAVCREAGVSRLFVNGVESASDHADSVNYASAGKIRVGSPTSAFADLNGYVKCVRITAAARYTTDFDPPTGPFPEQ